MALLLNSIGSLLVKVKYLRIKYNGCKSFGMVNRFIAKIDR